LWNVLQYDDAVSAFVDGLPPKLAGNVYSKITTLRSLGLTWRTNSIEPLGEETYELKVGQARLYFGEVGLNELIFVTCHLKKSKKEQSRIIEAAKKIVRWLRENRYYKHVCNIH
jgi:hypothetical protein